MLISTNIIRDQDLDFDYIVTDNAQRIFTELVEPNKTPGNCYNLIGSYGTGKSSFLVALEQSISGRKSFFKSKKRQKNVGFLKLIGKPQSLSVDSPATFHQHPNQQRLLDVAHAHFALNELKEFVEGVIGHGVLLNITNLIIHP
tara:strand:+ start:1131 stop:1562 length:432 start_codon:yes stop_codon:yes gene_type:complete